MNTALNGFLPLRQLECLLQVMFSLSWHTMTENLLVAINPLSLSKVASLFFHPSSFLV